MTGKASLMLGSVTAIFSLFGCSSNQTTQPANAPELAAGPKAQFECADRNANGYIDQTELVYLGACGVGEDLKCGKVPDVVEAHPSGDELEGGRRILKVIDVDGDDRISRLEFRAHCNSTGRAN